jgi:type IV pilus assembly protein PilY1
LKVWRLGDIVNSSPTIVGPPRERFDILYGDIGYRQYIQRWAKRRQTAYVGANDGMLHAFNVGYFHRADDPNTVAQERGWYTTNPTDNSSGAELGEELWGFVPYYTLPQLMRYPVAYTHISYVDLSRK